MDNTQIWTAAQERTIALAAGLTPEQAETKVPATDAWTIRQLVSHMVGVDDDALKGDVDEELSEGWTAHHVADREGRSLPEVLEEWRGLTPKVQELIGSADEETAGNLTVDTYWHEQDLRTALDDAPAQKDDPALLLGLTAFAEGFGEKVKAKGLPAVKLVAGDWSTVAGEGDPQVTVIADRYELGRALSGRRSADQVRAFSWAGDPEPYLPIFSMFGDLRPTDLVE